MENNNRNTNHRHLHLRDAAQLEAAVTLASMSRTSNANQQVQDHDQNDFLVLANRLAQIPLPQLVPANAQDEHLRAATVLARVPAPNQPRQANAEGIEDPIAFLGTVQENNNQQVPAHDQGENLRDVVAGAFPQRALPAQTNLRQLLKDARSRVTVLQESNTALRQQNDRLQAENREIRIDHDRAIQNEETLEEEKLNLQERLNAVETRNNQQRDELLNLYRQNIGFQNAQVEQQARIWQLERQNQAHVQSIQAMQRQIEGQQNYIKALQAINVDNLGTILQLLDALDRSTRVMREAIRLFEVMNQESEKEDVKAEENQDDVKMEDHGGDRA